jgi:hypothetical protein
MSGLGLVHLGFLGVAAAVAVPILIHLLLRPQARREFIGSVRFVKLVLRESRRSRKVRRWLLLALRSLAVLLLALLFARPYFSVPGGAGRDREAIILVDQSASMAAKQSGWTLFSAAQAEAEKILQRLPEGTAVHLAYFDDQGVRPAAEARIQMQRQPGYAGTDYGQALGWARDLLVLSQRPQQEVFVLTDLQQSGLHRTACTGFPMEVAVKVVELGKPLATNIAVENVEVTQTTLRAQEPITVTAQVSNSGVFAARKLEVRLRLEGLAGKLNDQVQTLDVAPGGYQPVRFSVPIDRPGLYTGWVEVTAEDGFPLDNRRWVALDVRKPDRLLLLDGEPGRTVFGNETYYLEAALRLALPGQGSPLTPYEPERLAFGAGTSLPDLSAYAAVVVCNVSRLADADLVRLHKFVSAGRGLLVFSGPLVQPAGYTAWTKAGLLPAAVKATAEAGLYRFQTWDQEHPIFRPLSDPQQGDLRRLAFRQITRLEPVAAANVLAATQSGEPLLVEQRVGRGGVLLFAAPADRDWSDWPQSRLYVPLIHQLVGYLCMRLPETQRVQQVLAGARGQTVPGITQDGDRTVVCNLDARESRLQRCSELQFREVFQLASAEAAVRSQQAAVAPLQAGDLRPDELWTSVVWILLLVLVGEVFVANRTHA